jgi:hypothetical protein
VDDYTARFTCIVMQVKTGTGAVFYINVQVAKR